MSERPYQKGIVVNLAQGQEHKDGTVLTVPAKKRFDIKFIGINAFGHQNQPLSFFLHVFTNGRLGTYPIALTGNSDILEPTFPKRFFGSQLVALYADPSRVLKFEVVRRETSGKVRVLVDMCGFLVDQ